MSQARTADVLVVAHDCDPVTLRCLESVLRSSGPTLNRLIIVASSPSAGALCRRLEQLTQADSTVLLVRSSAGLGDVEAYNRGLAERAADIVLLRSEVEVTSGWLEELADVVYSEQRTACVSPLANHEGCGSIPVHDAGHHLEARDVATLRAACAELPRWSAVPVLSCVCCYLRGDVIDAVGRLDISYPSPDLAVIDWVMRAQTLGFSAKRANHSHVRQMASNRPSQAKDQDDQGLALLSSRHPYLQPQLDWFDATLDRSIVSHAVRVHQTGRLRVAYDLRPLPPEQVGTRTYSVSLAKALGRLTQIDLTLLVRDPVQAQGLEGRVVTQEQWKDDVEVIHRPMQVIDPRDLRLLYESSAHLVLTYQDLIGYRIPQVFPNDAEFYSYRATSCLCLQGIQRILAYSESAAREIVEEFGVPREEVVVVPLGVDAGLFSRRDPGDRAIIRKLRLPERFFFSVATDFPHKNLPNLLEAYALFRAHWTQGPAPSLVLAGHTSSARGGFYQRLDWESQKDGLRFLGPISADQLRVLYQHAEALVFPSLYEGFGLPPLEAMAAGTPVIAIPISSVPEVGGDCVLYCDELSVGALARAMERLATDEDLRVDLRARGSRRAEHFCWEKTARETYEVYRSAVLQPSARSLSMRRRLREAILSWSEPLAVPQETNNLVSYRPVVVSEPLGVRIALKALNSAVQRRIRREMRRLYPITQRRSA
jgi:glycosyltransferase involved in cell wall biosynthesis